MRNKLMIVAAVLFFGIAAFAQDNSVRWTVSTSETADGTLMSFTGMVRDGFHLKGPSDEFNPLHAEYGEGITPLTEITAITPSKDYKGEKVYYGRAVFEQKVRSDGPVKGTLSYQTCSDVTSQCGPVRDWQFSAESAPQSETAVSSLHETPVSESGSADGTLWALIIEALLWGFAMLLTPCVFPMVPMTVSFFLKDSSSARQGRFKAFMYGFFIVLLYTLPIAILILATRWIGGEAVTADIFNYLATHWLPNLLFFVIFMVFAASFFGAFEITLPSSLLSRSDKGASRGGLLGVFFMALTLVLVSFSCTGPIVGTVIIRSLRGEFWTPIVTILAFSVAFALPFTILALFPELLKKLKSGNWLSSVKVVMGFIELALGLKFLSVADQTYHWGILDREVYLAIWIVIFTLLGIYLLDGFRFKGESKREHISLTRLILAIASFSFVVYMAPGMVGAPLKGLSGYLPPIQTQDFVISESAGTQQVRRKAGMKIPLGLEGAFTMEDAIQMASISGKKIFVDITGHGCVNCREMEERVWSDPTVRRRLADEFIVLALYTDDKTPLPEKDWVRTESGKVLKDIGRVNSHTVLKRFGVNSQPNYFILDSSGNILAGPYSYNLSVPRFLEFLSSGE